MKRHLLPVRSQDPQAARPPSTISKVADDPASLDSCDIRLIHPDRVAATRERLPQESIAERLADQFKLLSDPNRVLMVYALLEAGELCVCDLAATIGSSESATSHQLRLMRASDLVTFRKEGRIAYYRVADSHIRGLLDVAAQHQDHQ
jgi:DNA-binding transcriptional ArsR family regulator